MVFPTDSNKSCKGSVWAVFKVLPKVPTHSRYFILSVPDLVDATNVVVFSSVPSVGRMKQEPGEPRSLAVAGKTGKEHVDSEDTGGCLEKVAFLLDSEGWVES